uniref:PA domain-containing protein n=1 Tax=Haplochromis burtoni TaxID=8153 RepID=A0A3Q2X2E8_HAPBU
LHALGDGAMARYILLQTITCGNHLNTSALIHTGIHTGLRTEKTECGRYGEHSPKRDAKGVLVLPAAPLDRQACDPNTRFAVPAQAGAWVALMARGNCTYKDKIRHAAAHNASAVVIFNVGSTNTNDTITMPHPGR